MMSLLLTCVKVIVDWINRKWLICYELKLIWSLILDDILYLYSTEFLHWSVFICVLSLYRKWFTCGNMGTKESEFPGEREPVWANRACTFVAPMWVWKDGSVCLLFNVIPLSVWKYPSAALQTGMWFSMASQLFWTKTQVTSTIFTEMNKFILSLGFLF